MRNNKIVFYLFLGFLLFFSLQLNLLGRFAVMPGRVRGRCLSSGRTVLKCWGSRVLANSEKLSYHVLYWILLYLSVIFTGVWTENLSARVTRTIFKNHENITRKFKNMKIKQLLFPVYRKQWKSTLVACKNSSMMKKLKMTPSRIPQSGIH